MKLISVSTRHLFPDKYNLCLLVKSDTVFTDMTVVERIISKSGQLWTFLQCQQCWRKLSSLIIFIIKKVRLWSWKISYIDPSLPIYVASEQIYCCHISIAYIPTYCASVTAIYLLVSLYVLTEPTFKFLYRTYILYSTITSMYV